MSGSSGERLMSILDLFTEDRLEWSPQEIMELLGYSRPTLYRYLKLLKDTGFLSPVHGGGYGLGPRFVEMDFLTRKSDPLVAHGQVHLTALSQAYPGNAFLVRWYGERLLCVASASTDATARTSYPRGRPMPLTGGAAAKAILANLPQRQRQELAQRKDAGALGSSEAAILKSFRAIRRDGIARAYGEVTPGIVGVAAPVFDAGSQPIGSLCVSMDSKAFARIDAKTLADTIRAATLEISGAMAEPRHEATQAVGELK